MSSKRLLSLLLLFWCNYVSICLETTLETNKTFSNASDEKRNEVDLYRNLFKIKRKEHLAVVQELILVEDVSKLASFLKVSLATIVETLGKSLMNLEVLGYQVGDPFPKEMAVREELSKILENTAFFTDLIVRFPKPSHIFYKKNKKLWKNVMDKAIDACEYSGVFDGEYQVLLHNLKQELGIGMKDDNYNNPFFVPEMPQNELTSEERQELYQAAKRKQKLSKQKKKQKKPKITFREDL